MKILVNLFHPRFSESKVNRVWAETVSKLANVTLNNVYARYPDERIDVSVEQKLLLAADRVVFQHPFYWYSSPALMKKWLDEVLTYGWAYGPNATALHGKEWVSAISAGGPGVAYQAGGFNNFTISELLRPFQQTANLCGMTYLPPFSIHDAMRLSEADIVATAKAYAEHIVNPDINPKVLLRKMMGG